MLVLKAMISILRPRLILVPLLFILLMSIRTGQLL